MRKRVIPSVFFAQSSSFVVRVSSRTLSEFSALEIQTLWPVTRQAPSPLSAAKVFVRVVSRPVSGSVTPKQTCIVPSTIPGSVRAFSTASPCLMTGCIPKIIPWIALAPFMPAPEAENLLEQQRGLGDPEPAAPVLLRDADAQPARVRDRLVEVSRELVRGVAREPVLVVELGAELAVCGADRLPLVGQAKSMRATLRLSVESLAPPRGRRRRPLGAARPPASPPSGSMALHARLPQHRRGLVRADKEGYLVVVDRIKDVVNTGGVLVASREVEDALYGHPAVAEVAVTGLPDPRWIEAIAAVVVLKGQADEAELVAWAREHLATHKAPEAVHVVDALPKNASGKLLKRELRERFGGDSSAVGRRAG